LVQTREGPGVEAGGPKGAGTALVAGSSGIIETIDSGAAVTGWTEVIGVWSADQAAVAASASEGTPPAKAEADAGAGAGMVIS
jgi:hypothetical protein